MSGGLYVVGGIEVTQKVEYIPVRQPPLRASMRSREGFDVDGSDWRGYEYLELRASHGVAVKTAVHYYLFTTLFSLHEKSRDLHHTCREGATKHAEKM